MSNDYALGEKLLTKGEVAQICRVECRTVDRWVAAGKILCYRTPGGRVLFRKKDVLIAVERGVDAIRRAPMTFSGIVGQLLLFTAAVVA